jgi:hypothetical protein
MKPGALISWYYPPFKRHVRRSWPSAFYSDNRIAADIQSTERLVYNRVNKAAVNLDLIVRIADYSKTEHGWTWRTLKSRATTFKQAKKLAEDFLANNTKYGVNK